ncbi:helix-turn-helix domain-containing protein [Myroides marinus]|uniref:helix-turn-helix domain-containing protein n=1 Tax=Myroides marinus TaxID=703342 RepID=UPI00074233C1|nr:helix-turn-helix domain-containing protein [Myroides marinus]KUF43178.1 AraC family transcriptional regulator [Myroides marinus]MDM1373037.1 helix-turn-helix domain-containing protein [Myroides marinus]
MKRIPRYNSCDLLDQNNVLKDCVIFDLHRIIQMRNNVVSIAHHHAFYQILLITGGSGIHYIDNESHSVAKGDIFFLSPGQVHRWDFNETTQGFIINFTADFFSSFLLNSDFVQSLPFFEYSSEYSKLNIFQQFSTVVNIFDKITFEYQIKEHCDSNLIRIYILELLLLLKKQINEENNFSYNQLQPSNLVKQYEHLVEKNFYELRFPKEYAKLLYVTPNYLNAICQKIKGQSAGEIIRSRILLESKRLLVNTNLSAGEIAYKLSFKDNSYFSRFFKKYVGVSPDEYRKS